MVYCGILWLVVFYQWLNSRQWAELHCETPNWQYLDSRKKKVLKHHQYHGTRTNPSLTGHQVFHFFIIRRRRSSELSIPSPHVTSCTDTSHTPTPPDSLQRSCREITHKLSWVVRHEGLEISIDHSDHLQSFIIICDRSDHSDHLWSFCWSFNFPNGVWARVEVNLSSVEKSLMNRS